MSAANSRSEAPETNPPDKPSQGDLSRFLKAWRGAPLQTGAFAPSSRALARAMAEEVLAGRKPGQLIEVGPGTGPFTRALLEIGYAEENLTLIEYNPAFVDLLRERFPRARIVRGSAFHIAEIAAEHGITQVDGVVSGLPLYVYPVPDRQKLVREAVRLSGPDGGMVQFTYFFKSPVPRLEGVRQRYRRFVPLNLWPASVWRYSQA
ncbi:MAG TPA: methyltransferase domain-containing protein [Acetobacteraceae bacterium]|nr:methyltransferase domain-containing protein [Acetobacteraceae bacterium]